MVIDVWRAYTCMQFGKPIGLGVFNTMHMNTCMCQSRGVLPWQFHQPWSPERDHTAVVPVRLLTPVGSNMTRQCPDYLISIMID